MLVRDGNENWLQKSVDTPADESKQTDCLDPVHRTAIRGRRDNSNSAKGNPFP